jgi:hypothetical protein
VIIHNGDHVRRGADKLSADVLWLGMLGVVFEVVLIVLIFQRHWVAPLAALLGGLALAAGYIEVHLVPRHGLLSDSFTSAAHVSPLSWFAASLEIVAAVIVAMLGARQLRAMGGLSALAEPNRGGAGFRASRVHPIVALIVLTQTATLVISLAQSYG